MWLQKKKNEQKTKRRYSEEYIEIERKRVESKKPKLESSIIGKENSFRERPKNQDTGGHKWGHGGYWELYPELNRKERKEESSSESEKSTKKIKKIKKVKKPKVSHNKNKKTKKDKKLKKHKKKPNLYNKTETTQISSESDYWTD